MRILLVEDNPGDAELIRLFLENADGPGAYVVTEVPRLQQAMELLAAESFDLVVLDLGLPDSTGIETLNKMIARSFDLPIVVLTGNRDDQLGLQAVKSGAQDFLSKGHISSQILGRVLRYAYERKQAEVRQRNIEKKMETILDALDIQVLLLANDHTIEWPNRKVCESFGLSREEIIGRRCYELWSDGQTGYCESCPVEKVLATGDFHTDYRRVKVNKTWDVKACPVRDKHGRIASVVEMRTDVSDRVELEEQFFQAQKMEAVGRLAGGVAHDFNNILSIIFGFADIARQQVKEDESLGECLDEILNAGQRAAGLVRQLLAFSRRETIDPRVLDCNEILDSSQKMLKRLVGEDVEVKFQPGANLWKVRIDPTQLEQILINLVVNSRDAILGVGLITIATNNRILDETYCLSHLQAVPGDYVELVVSDTGKGMSREVLSKIFEPFFTTKKQGQGTGLGMSTIFGIVQQNNGVINVYSEEGKGTTVNILFPRNIGENKVDSETNTKISATGKETILVVEDDQAILRICRNILSEFGYRILVDSDPRQAVRTAEEYGKPIDLLLTDVIMPNMNGSELRRAVEAIHPQIKTLFMSGYTSDIISHQGILAEGLHFLQKPFTKRQLAEKIRNALDS